MPAGVGVEVYVEEMSPLPTSANFVFTREDGVKVDFYLVPVLKICILFKIE